MANEPKGKILIADDDAHTRNLLRELAESWGHSTVVAADGEQALAAISDPSSPATDLVLLDLMMPKVDGFGVLKALRAAPATQRLPVILLTAAGDVDDKLKGIELGADDYVTKPFRISDLQNRVAAALNKRHDAATQEPRDPAHTDPLTGVGTYPQLKETLVYEVERARRYGRPLTALVVAMDESPLLLDKLGRAAANELLSQLAAALRRSFRFADRVFRIDVESFVVLLPETATEGAQIAAHRLAAGLNERPLAAPGSPRKVTISVGVADFPRFGNDKADDLVRAANHALLRAQRGGSAQVELAQDGEAGA
ncbi:MAG: response regulator [Deltaproteobacteria bacterium]|nr:response regulator [Deltaproteobacteria bacterium]